MMELLYLSTVVDITFNYSYLILIIVTLVTTMLHHPDKGVRVP